MIYADSTFLVAFKASAEAFHKVSLAFYEKHQDEVFASFDDDQLSLAKEVGLDAVRPR